MAIIANTLTSHTAVGIRESLADVIYNISPESTPFVSNMTKRKSISNTFFLRRGPPFTLRLTSIFKRSLDTTSS